MRTSIFAATVVAALIASIPTEFAAAQDPIEGRAPRLDPKAFPDLTRIYRFSGVSVTGLTHNQAVQTSAHCTNWHATFNREVRYIFRNKSGRILGDVTIPIGPLDTATVSSWGTRAFIDDATTNMIGFIDQGSLEILATGPQVHCTAMVLDAASTNPTFTYPLVGTRNNQEGGSHE